MNLYLTLDYELFLGSEAGTPENCIINPMNALCKAVEDYGARFTVFVDAAYLYRLTQLKPLSSRLSNDYNAVVTNIKELNNRGHDIQFHFHPQWIYSEWDEDNQKWKLDYTHYKLSDMDRVLLIQSFTQAKQILDTIIGKKTIAFRAGGHCLESYDNYIELFEENGILIDSTVLKGQCNLSPKRFYDFRNIDAVNTVYNFSSSIQKEDVNGKFIEVPISFCKWNKLHYLLSSMRSRMMNYSPQIYYGDGISFGNSIEKKTIGHKNKITARLAPIKSTACSSGPYSVWLMDIFAYAKKRNWQNLVFIGHPKDETDASIRNLGDFVASVYKQCDFKTMRDLI